MAPITPSISRKRSFWRKKTRSRRSDEQPLSLFTAIEAVEEKEEPPNEVPPAEPTDTPPTSPTEGKMHRLIGWMKSWHPQKEHKQVDATGVASEEAEPVSPVTEERASTEFSDGTASLLTAIPQSFTLDGANDSSPTSLPHLPKPPRIHRRASFRKLLRKVEETADGALKHSRSNAAFVIRKRAAACRNPTGTVVHRSGLRSLSILAPMSLNNGSRPSVLETFAQSIAAGDTQPTLRTVEVTAAAKFYLEAHFAQLLVNPNPRSLRRRRFETQLKRMTSEQQIKELREEWRRKETEYLRVMRSKKLTLGDYEIVKVIGKGAFGVVKLVRERNSTSDPSITSSSNHESSNVSDSTDAGLMGVDISGPSNRRDSKGKKTPEVFALKVMRKGELLLGGQEGHLFAERDFLVASQGSRWIVPLVAAFQDTENLYLVMEYMIGGDFLAHLINRNVLSEDETRFYVAEMICCIEEAHALGYIHRDVKPDNFLFTSDGHLKLCDFGLAFSGHYTHDGQYRERQRHTLLETVGIEVEGDTIDKKEGKRIVRCQENMQGGGGDSGGSGSQKGSAPPPGPLEWTKTDRGLARSIVGTNQ